MEERLTGLESIIQTLDCNIKLLEYMSFDLHQKQFNLYNNMGLLWIWKSILESQIINFYKLNIVSEKFSFKKVLNLLRVNEQDVDYENLEMMIQDLKDDFDKYQFALIRSKYLAHQDICDGEVRTDLLIIRMHTDKTIILFKTMISEIQKEHKEFSDDILNSFKEIFEKMNESEKVSAYKNAAKK